MSYTHATKGDTIANTVLLRTPAVTHRVAETKLMCRTILYLQILPGYHVESNIFPAQTPIRDVYCYSIRGKSHIFEDRIILDSGLGAPEETMKELEKRTTLSPHPQWRIRN